MQIPVLDDANCFTYIKHLIIESVDSISFLFIFAYLDVIFMMNYLIISSMP